MQTEIELKKSTVKVGRDSRSSLSKIKRKRTIREENKASGQYFNMDFQFN